MIKKLIIGLCLFTSCAFAQDKIVLTESNLVVFEGEVESTIVGKTILALETNQSKEIYLYINSPGGSIIEGIKLVQYLKNTQKNIVCVADFAASMAHAILESCPKRVGTETNLLLQHKASMTAEGSASEITGQLKVLRGLELYLNVLEAKRVGKTLEEFQQLTTLPWVTFGEESVKEKLLDSIAVVTCSPELYKKSTIETGRSLFGIVSRTTNACPLVPQFIESVDR